MHQAKRWSQTEWLRPLRKPWAELWRQGDTSVALRVNLINKKTQNTLLWVSETEYIKKLENVTFKYH